MTTTDSVTRLQLAGREFIIVGTAHVSAESVAEVDQAIRREMPDRVCVEIDEGRFKALSEQQSWANLDIYQVLRQKKGFLLMANLVLSSFQRRIGADLGTKPGTEMLRAVDTAREMGIAYSFADREVQTTLRRAWAKSSFWGKNKLLSALLSSVLSSEKLSAEQVEALKKKSELQSMMDELAAFMPSVKEVLIDERDQYLAARIFEAQGNRVLAVVGAGHVPGMVKWLEKFAAGQASTDTSTIAVVPKPGIMSKIIPWLVPVAVGAFLAAGFLRGGIEHTLSLFWTWAVVNGAFSAVGAMIALANPLTILVSFVAAPIAALNPAIGVGMITGPVEAFFRKPRVQDLEHLHEDIASLSGFYRNRVTRILLVFLLSSVGSMVGTFAGFPFISGLIK